MCGFVGIFSRDGTEFSNDSVLHRMNCTIMHRGPDESGFHSSGPLGMAFRRLSVIDVPGGKQPMVDKQTGISLVFNGEIYNYKEIRAELERSGTVFYTKSDTEVLLQSFVKWGPQCVDHLNGMFAFAAWDPASRTLTLARDRLGVKPLYYTEIGNQFVFASEVKAFFQHPGFVKKANLAGISSYLSFRQPVGGLTYFEGVHKVLPGERLVVTQGNIRKERYWALPKPAPDYSRTEADWLEALSNILEKSIKRCLVSDVPIGAYLSGGLDSSILVAHMGKYMKTELKTFSIGYDINGYDEGEYARQAAESAGAEHTHLLLSKRDFIDGTAPLIEQCDAPLMLPQMVAVLKLSKEIRKHVKVALCGDGADELFGGYGRVMRSPFDWQKIEFMRNVGRPMLGELQKMEGGPFGSLNNLDCQTHLEHFLRMYHWMPIDEKMSLLTDDARARLNGDEQTLSVFKEAFDEVADCDPHDRVLHIFQKIHLNCVLDKVDTMGMLASLEGRVPFVDHELVETFVHMPHHLKMKWNSPDALLEALSTNAFEASEKLDQTKYLLRQHARTLLPEHLANRKKLGFPTPLDDWLKSGLLEEAKSILLDKSAFERGIFERKALEQILQNPQQLDYDFYGKKVWMLMNVELWFQRVMDADSRIDNEEMVAARYA
ncbi:asparagine synthase (glutamine-hydrolyzing) [Agrobacterium vitis]|uniref:asparagine synthase (glutamine-hydrolyzing) n=1 Tax=Agrobacterium vitis TaxID=373 RepID=UPI0020357EDE|nr:asparagine synthase (glutamine-hydrolyzing) [Agrobacterium vitis]MCM2453287.1 asparagine synthase (glutamine-hydrolyzing) [Agrobacterium vitis]